MIGPLPYIGGKRRLAPSIVRLLPEHTTYVEPFAGGAQVFFHKPPSSVEVLNDTDEEIVNFFRICRRHPEELGRILSWLPTSRRLFEWYRAGCAPDATDIERAACFFYRQRHSWSGKRRFPSFRYRVTARKTHSPRRLSDRLMEVAERLENVVIEAQSYEKILNRYDRPSTFFYCDPPYIDVHLYAHNFTDQQFQELAAHLGSITGRFLLSINDHPKAHQWFSRFHSRLVQCVYTSTRTPGRFTELLFSNYPLPE